jgi:hypothetical protein
MTLTKRRGSRKEWETDAFPSGRSFGIWGGRRTAMRCFHQLRKEHDPEYQAMLEREQATQRAKREARC